MSMIPSFRDFLLHEAQKSLDVHEFISDDNMLELWREVYGTDFRSEHPEMYRILKQRAKMDSRELARIWDERYDEKISDAHPKIWSRLQQ
jgi:hypothetical protein